jgi:GTP1/Obg family GTP-binding protein
VNPADSMSEHNLPRADPSLKKILKLNGKPSHIRHSIRKVLANRIRFRATKYSSPAICTCVVCGGENVGKTQLLASLTNKLPTPENFRGSTIACETYRDGDLQWTDTPGILRESETSAARSSMEEIHGADLISKNWTI